MRNCSFVCDQTVRLPTLEVRSQATLQFARIEQESNPGLLMASISSSTDFLAEKRLGMPLFTLAKASSRIEKSLRVIRVRGDGKCMFRAIALGLARNQGRFLGSDAEQREADNLRLAVAEALCRTPKRRRQFGQAVIALEAEDTLKNYCRRIQSPTFWGGEPEMMVLSQMLKVPIFVYLSDSEYGGTSGFTVIQKYGEKYRKGTKDSPPRRPVRLLFTGGNHFDLLIK